MVFVDVCLLFRVARRCLFSVARCVLFVRVACLMFGDWWLFVVWCML